jgi:hypothetical protein
MILMATWEVALGWVKPVASISGKITDIGEAFQP